jgi:hypothetical protein
MTPGYTARNKSKKADNATTVRIGAGTAEVHLPPAKIE